MKVALETGATLGITVEAELGGSKALVKDIPPRSRLLSVSFSYLGSVSFIVSDSPSVGIAKSASCPC